MAHPSLYSPLENRRDFRLMRIKPTNGTDIEIEFEVYRLDSDVKFTALSYVWGDPKVQNQIVCNGRNVPITSNLWEVLLQLKHQGCSGLIWADAICINQQDNIEKGIQVNMMRSIYSRAATVIFWLGKEQRYDKDAVRLMNTFFSNNRDHIDLEPFRASSL
ncbi:hypothetical protein BS50DRAFT_509025 [Corynespora cassiicola Philippines]|uniref:Heterokaryon incompatibility domain-containing protein n=1 Tax=Corynespora cassiicola Philippines TaxID=1448308 RepID=A0A2T2N121_CORCC|nr:hypothetical protein BS50DRAFT_509025 [Corynespora cassiicola Philippines]